LVERAVATKDAPQARPLLINDRETGRRCTNLKNAPQTHKLSPATPATDRHDCAEFLIESSGRPAGSIRGDNTRNIRPRRAAEGNKDFETIWISYSS
jgi:hypothetical protein